jgi:hypothetical protein
MGIRPNIEGFGMNLSTENYKRARLFIKTHARIIDRCLFNFYFNIGPAGDVLEALRAYQNPDGGFGRALEPDFRLPASSPMATSVGLQTLIAVGTPPDHPLVQAAVQYLVNIYRTDGDYWPMASLEINDHPHAPWWSLDEIAPPPEDRWANPCAELVGYLHYCSDIVPPDLLTHATERARQNLESGVAFGKGQLSFYQLLTWERAADFLPDALAADARDRILAAYRTLSPLTQEKLSELPVIALLDFREPVVVQAFPEDVDRLLDSIIHQQAEDGGWWPAWHWGMYEDVWPIAKKEWAGRITVDVLHSLKKFGRLTK